jgi:conjugative relaxase-like TrwC/TraI family protein
LNIWLLNRERPPLLKGAFKMLSCKILTGKNIDRLANYYEEAADDYYSKEGDFSSWQGKGAALLNLSGSVDAKQLKALLLGKIDSIQARQFTRSDLKERIGIDLTFSAPKSVSMQALIDGDQHIIKAHDASVKKALMVAEERALARKKIKGKSRVEPTGNLIVATFRHETSREKDPQLHTHAVVMNLTHRSDGKWCALKNDEIIKSTRYLGAVYRSELALTLKSLGYEIRHGRDGMFELAHISRKQIKAFSLRAKQVEDALLNKGLDRRTATTSEKQQATLNTRAPKTPSNRDEIFNDWVSRAKALDIEFSPGKHPNNKEGHDALEQTSKLAAKRAVKFAINHLTERQSILQESKLLDTALSQAMGHATLRDIEQEIQHQITSGYLIINAPCYKLADEKEDGCAKTVSDWIKSLANKGISQDTLKNRVLDAIENGRLIRIEARYTTQTALEIEKRILCIEKTGRHSVLPIFPDDASIEPLKACGFNQSQMNSAQLILTTTNRVVGIQGIAGSGKSYLLSQVKLLAESQGFKIKALAPYGSQVKALRELGIPANTLASFLRGKDKHINANTLVILDEAGVVPARLMEQTLKLIEKQAARMVMIGDTHQTKAIEAGRPFDQLQTSGMQTTLMDEIQRQKNPLLKKAVQKAFKRQITESLTHIQTLREIPQPHKRFEKIADEYVKLFNEKQKDTLIVCGTNKARREINQHIREQLKLSGKGKQFDTLIRRDTTRAERQFSKYYRINDIIQPEKDYLNTGLKRGELYQVIETGPANQLTVESKGALITFNPMIHQKLSVYRFEQAELSQGDLVRINRNDAHLDLANGDRFYVQQLDKNHIVLSDGKRHVSLDTQKPLHLEHAYASTIHSSQGLTCDHVLIDIDTNSITTNQDIYYVAISRARLEAMIYTDNLNKLPEGIMRESIKHAALDIQLPKHHTQSKRKRTKNPGDKGGAVDTPAPNAQISQAEFSTPPQPILQKPYDDPKSRIQKLRQDLNERAIEVANKYLGTPKNRSNKTWRYGTRQGSLAVTVKGNQQGLWYDFSTGDGGDMLSLISQTTQINDFKALIKEATAFLGHPSPALKENNPIKKQPLFLDNEISKKIKTAQKIIAESLPLPGTLAERYLRMHRGIHIPLDPKTFRYHPSLKNWKTKALSPALLITSRDEKNQICGVQAIFLDTKTAQKINKDRLPKLS